MKTKHKKTLWGAVGLILAAGAWLGRASDIDATLDSIVGPKSSIALRHGTRLFLHAHHLYAHREENFHEYFHRIQHYNHDKIILLAKNEAKHAPRRILPPAEYQNLTLTFVNPHGQPVPGLPMVATVHQAFGADGVLRGLTTNAQGQVTLLRVGKLPASVDLAIAPTAGTRADPDWQFSDVHAASLLLPKGRGQRVAEALPPPFRVASLVPVFPNPAWRAFLGGATSRSTVYRYQEPHPIVVERGAVDLDVTAPAGSQVTTPALPGQAFQVPPSGHLTCHFPSGTMDDGPVPLRVASTLPAGQREAVITSFPTDPYGQNTVTAPPLQLVTLSSVRLMQGVGVLARRDDIARTLGTPKGRNDLDLRDGSRLWMYPQQGLGIRLRPLPGDDGGPAAIADRIRVFQAQGGDVAGLRVGQDTETWEQTLGPPETESNSGIAGMDAQGSPGVVDTYLDGGLRVCNRNGKVLWWEVARATRLLVAGTTAFAPRSPARLFIRSFRGQPHSSLPDTAALRQYLEQVHSVRLEDSAATADLILDARVVGFQESREKASEAPADTLADSAPAAPGGVSEEVKHFFIGLPVSYSCRTSLNYTLTDTAAGRPVVLDKTVTGAASADCRQQLEIVGIVSAILLLQKKRVVKEIGGVLALVSLEAARETITRAMDRCPGISARTAFDGMVQDINHASDFSVRVTGIDYTQNRITLNVGSDQGVQASTKDDPYEFDLIINGQPLPNNFSPFKADYYTATVIGVSDQSCVCQLHHQSRDVDQFGKEHIHDDAVNGRHPEVRHMLQHLPDPATGLISARAATHFAPLPIVSDQPRVGLAPADHRRQHEWQPTRQPTGLRLARH